MPQIEVEVTFSIEVNQPLTEKQVRNITVKIDERLFTAAIQFLISDLVPLNTELVGHETTSVVLIDPESMDT